MDNFLHPSPIDCKTVWLSDIHLGAKDCQVDYLLQFLNTVQCDELYLLGDIVDLWAMKKRFWWPPSHYEVIQVLFKKAQQGTRIVYIPGNHDAPMREYVSSLLGRVEIMEEAIYTTAAGKKLLLVHGDCFDEHIRIGRLGQFVGDFAYPFLLWTNRYILKLRSLMGYGHWSLASYVKNRIKNARAAIDTYENAAIAEAKRRQLDGIICGHIHQPDLKVKDGVMYCNDGDWVEHCTALVEGQDGKLQLLDCTTLSVHADIPPLAANDGAFAMRCNLGE